MLTVPKIITKRLKSQNFRQKLAAETWFGLESEIPNTLYILLDICSRHTIIQHLHGLLRCGVLNFVLI